MLADQRELSPIVDKSTAVIVARTSVNRLVLDKVEPFIHNAVVPPQCLCSECG